MRPFWGIDVTENHKNDKFNGDEFVIKELTEEQTRRFDQAMEQAERVDTKSELPLSLSLLKGICMVLVLVAAAGIVNAWRKHLTLAQSYVSAPFPFWVLGLCAAVWLALTLMERKRGRDAARSGEAERVATEIGDAERESYAALGVPEDARKTDVLCMVYRAKDGEPVPAVTMRSHTGWFLATVMVFVSDGKLCLADVEKRYAIPLSSLRCIRAVNKSVSTPYGGRLTPPNDEDPKEYHIPSYRILEFDHLGDAWGLYLPDYEQETFEALTGLKTR